MKWNLKKLILPVLLSFVCFFPKIKVHAAKFTTYNPTNHVIILNKCELDYLRIIGHSITTLNNRYVITSIGHPKNIDIEALPECYLFKIDYMRPISTSKVRYAHNGITLMSVTLSDEIYKNTSFILFWSCLSVYDSKMDCTYLFKVCTSHQLFIE